MENFNYNIPTEIFFGQGKIDQLGKEIKKYGSKVLLTYGGDSIKKNSIYQEVIKNLDANNITYVELSGIDPNPRIESVREGISLARKENVDFILAVGGGSTIDCSKVIAAGYYYDGDPWDLVIRKAKIENALPLASVLTLAATGSEMDQGAVISNLETKEKYGIGHRTMAPKFSILDPTYTYTVNTYHTGAGVVDIMSHCLENYFSINKTAYLQDRMAEGVIKTCIEYGPKAIEDPEDYEARSNLMWASSLAINGVLSYGKKGEWSVHPMEHELSAYYDLTHGVGLGILTPNWMEYVLSEDTLYKFVEYGIGVWNLSRDLEDMEIARLSIEKTRDFIRGLGLPTRLSEVGIGSENIERMARELIAYKEGPIRGFVQLDFEDIVNIYKMSL